MRASKTLKAAGVRGFCQAFQHSKHTQSNLANVSRISSIASVQSDAGSQDYAWAQHLLRASAGFAFAAGSFAALASSDPARCEQQASAGQTVVCLNQLTFLCAYLWHHYSGKLLPADLNALYARSML